MAARSLFRAESENARSTSWLGRVILIRPLSFAFATAAAAAIAMTIAAFFVFGEYTRKSRVTGVLAPAQGVVRIVAPQAGVVVALHVREGEPVAADAPVIVVADSRANLSSQEVGGAVASKVQARRAALKRQRAHALAAALSEQQGLAHRRDGLLRELERLGAEVSAESSRLALSGRSLDRARTLEGTGFVSFAAREHEENLALEQASRVESLRRNELSLRRDIAAAEYDLSLARSRAESQVAALDLQAASLEQEALERDIQYRATLVAPVSGTIAAVLVEPGQTVSAGTTLATVLPQDAQLEAHLYSPSRSIGFIRPGQDVLLRYVAYPYQKFGSHRARVSAISSNPLLPGELGFSPPDGSREPVYRIKAALDAQAIRAYGKPEPLQAGMQVEADILLDRRTLIEWVFEPLLSLAGRT